MTVNYIKKILNYEQNIEIIGKKMISIFSKLYINLMMLYYLWPYDSVYLECTTYKAFKTYAH